MLKKKHYSHVFRRIHMKFLWMTSHTLFVLNFETLGLEVTDENILKFQPIRNKKLPWLLIVFCQKMKMMTSLILLLSSNKLFGLVTSSRDF